MSQQTLEPAFQLLESCCEGALATLEDHKAYASAVGYFFERDKGGFGRIYMFLSDLARHTKNLARNQNASLLVVEKKEAPIQECKRVSAQGRVKKVEDETKTGVLKEKLLKVFPRSSQFLNLPDFHFYELDIIEIHWVGGFGQIETQK